jgi:hypothetical protein
MSWAVGLGAWVESGSHSRSQTPHGLHVSKSTASPLMAPLRASLLVVGGEQYWLRSRGLKVS